MFFLIGRMLDYHLQERQAEKAALKYFREKQEAEMSHTVGMTDEEYKLFCELILNRKPKMTREEAVNKFHDVMYPESFGKSTTDFDFTKDRKWAEKAIDAYEALGLIKFEKNKEPLKSISLNKDKFFGDVGAINLERWPEGLVIWVGGKIIYKSWIA